MEIQGVVKVIMETQTFDSGFQKREFVVETQEQYPQLIKLELIKDKCSLIDKFPVGSGVKVQFNLRGNLYNERYFVNLQAWKLEGGASTSQNPQDDEQDLPF